MYGDYKNEISFVVAQGTLLGNQLILQPRRVVYATSILCVHSVHFVCEHSA